ncbi:Aminopeptidase N [Dermatophilus congolensis]|uniref:Aminopeptidase N n=1 Tax=Dermatophilus congolensis TaxID=1863 RepID=A0AA46BQ10_9MICO|nr:M1 family metallopeptidase [Dermatophilus congolensis]STD14593.1 Aminopeptidase N [Dermatophilus congolensis]
MTNFSFRRPIALSLAAALALSGSAMAAVSLPAMAQSSSAHTAVVPSRDGSVGSPGIGDSYFPDHGNGGYDVQHYDVNVSYEPKTRTVTGTTSITALTTQNLTQFNLDLALTPEKVLVDGKPASFSRQSTHELVVRPSQALTKGAKTNIVVTYKGVPEKIEIDGEKPWITTSDGAVAVGQPYIASWWFPSNDHPRDKATFSISLNVPKGLKALSNGSLQKVTNQGSTDTWSWQESTPMAPYLAFAVIGRYDILRGKTSSGIPWLTATPQSNESWVKRAKEDLAKTPAVIDWLSKTYGPYPFTTTGGIAANADMGFALENQSRPVYSSKFWAKGHDLSLIVHEQSHQWFGDSTSVRDWKDIWINEGFATWTEWMYAEKHDGPNADEAFAQAWKDYAQDSSFWKIKIGDPGPKQIFNRAVYDRGAMTVQALRNKVGEEAFWKIVRGWVASHRHGHGSVQEFMTYANKHTSQDLRPFFEAWLFTPGKPNPSADLGFPKSMIR